MWITSAGDMRLRGKIRGAMIPKYEKHYERSVSYWKIAMSIFTNNVLTSKQIHKQKGAVMLLLLFQQRMYPTMYGIGVPYKLGKHHLGQ